jgi:hypothetical protein
MQILTLFGHFQPSVAEGFGYVLFRDAVDACEVRQGSGDAEDAMVASGGEFELFGGFG